MEELKISSKEWDQKVFFASPREILMKYLPFLPWVIASVLLCLTIAFVKLRYSPNIYNVAGTLIVKDDNPYGSKTEKFDEILLAQPNRNLNDEIQIIKSRNMAKRVVKSLALDVEYHNKGKIRSTLVYYGESPVSLRILDLKDSSSPFSIPVIIQNDNEFKVSETGPSLKFNQAFENSSGHFVITRNHKANTPFSSNHFYINYTPVDMKAEDLINNLSASLSGESNNIVQMSFTTENSKVGIDIVNQWMSEYKLVGLEDKKQIAFNTLAFIDDQLNEVRQELSIVEKNLQGYREKNKVFNPQEQSQYFFGFQAELEKEINANSVKNEVIDNLIGYLTREDKLYSQVGSNLGINEPSLGIQISEFNKLQLQRETMLKTTTRSNPMAKDIESGIDKLRMDIIQNLNNIKRANHLVIQNLKSRSFETNRELSSIPSKEKQLLDIMRRQKILEELYSYLLQKKLETSIGSASTISNVSVIEAARSTSTPVSPNRKAAYVLAFFLGMAIPSAFIILLEFLNDKVNSRQDIQRVTDLPIIGEIGHIEDTSSLVVNKTSRHFVAEQFRIIRTNLQYVLPDKDKMTILITSSFSGEGKSFISTNLGAVISITGKKTVILEFDIRKPKVASSLKLSSQKGITNFMIGKTTVEELPIKVPNYDNLYVIPCGPVPPNPSELLLSDRLGQLFAEVQRLFDVIVIDTAPIGLVSDSLILSKFADLSLYVVRHNYTFKKQLHFLNELTKNNRIPKVSLVVNDISTSGVNGKYYGYGGSYNGYGYGYSSEYFDSEMKNGSGIVSRLKKFFGNKV